MTEFVSASCEGERCFCDKHFRLIMGPASDVAARPANRGVH
jgi:hypothetical protein